MIIHNSRTRQSQIMLSACNLKKKKKQPKPLLHTKHISNSPPKNEIKRSACKSGGGMFTTVTPPPSRQLFTQHSHLFKPRTASFSRRMLQQTVSMILLTSRQTTSTAFPSPIKLHGRRSGWPGSTCLS